MPASGRHLYLRPPISTQTVHVLIPPDISCATDRIDVSVDARAGVCYDPLNYRLSQARFGARNRKDGFYECEIFCAWGLGVPEHKDNPATAGDNGCVASDF